MAEKDGLRIEKHSSVSLTVPVLIARANPKRYKLQVRPAGANGCLVGVDEGMSDSNSYFIPQNDVLKLKTYKGAVYALSVTAVAAIYVVEEDV